VRGSEVGDWNGSRLQTSTTLDDSSCCAMVERERNVYSKETLSKAIISRGMIFVSNPNIPTAIQHFCIRNMFLIILHLIIMISRKRSYYKQL